MSAQAHDEPTLEVLAHLDQGDLGAAAESMVVAFADDVYSLCHSMVRNAPVAEELSQDVFARAFRGLAKFRRQASIRTWLLRIARNRCLDYLRLSARAPSMVDSAVDAIVAPEPSVVDVLVHRETLESALGALRSEDRALVVLRFGRGLSYPEIAATFGLKQGTVRMRLSRAVARMRETFDELPGATTEVMLRPPGLAVTDAELRGVDPLPAPTPVPVLDESTSETIPAPPPDLVRESTGVAAVVADLADALLEEGSGPRRIAAIGDTIVAPRIDSEIPGDTIPAGPPSSTPAPSTIAAVVTSLTEALRDDASLGLRRRLLELAALVP